MTEVLNRIYAAGAKFRTGEILASGRVKTPVARASYANVFRPQKPIQGAVDQTPKYGIVLLFPADADLTLLKTMASNAAAERWGTDPATGMPKFPPNFRSPFRDQGEKAAAGYVAGAKFITLSSKERPGLVDAAGRPIDDETMFYSGCWCQVSVNAYSYDKAGNRGVSFGLSNIQKIADDAPLSGRPRAESEFAAVEIPGLNVGAAAAAGAAAIFD